MMQIIAVLAVFLPLLGSIINGLFCRKLSDSTAAFVSSGMMIISSLLALILFYHVGINKHIIHVVLLKWFTIGNISSNWAIYIDALSAVLVLVVNWVSTVVHIYSVGYMHGDKLPKFLSFLSLFTFCMLMLVSADNFLQLFFGWEGVGLCSYLLIGFWYKKNAAGKAAIKAFITNRVGDFAFILGIILIILYTDHIDFKGVFSQAKHLTTITPGFYGLNFNMLDLICLLLFIGCMGKSAQIGLHVWLPDAMEGPTPVSALIHAATMVTAGVFLVARCSYLFEYSPLVLQLITLIGGITCLFAALVAIAQSDIKKIIAYSTCSQLGYMFFACGLSAYQAGIFHLVTHAFFKALLFLSAGSIIHSCHEQNIFKMGGLMRKMPITYINFWIGSLALIGIFPLAGFYSKDLILESAYIHAGTISNAVFILGLAAAFCTAVYSLKIIILTFHGQTKLASSVFEHTHEAPKVMNLPLLILVAGALFAGMLGHYILSFDKPYGYFGASILNMHLAAEHQIQLWVKLLPIVIATVGAIIGIYTYGSNLYILISSRLSFVYKLLQNKFYFDELYSALIVKPMVNLSKVLNLFDRKVIDGWGVSGFAGITKFCSDITCRLQSGYIPNYALCIILTLIIGLTFFLVNFIRVI